MAEEKEIKINESDFDDAIKKIDNLIKDLCDAYKIIAAQNQKLVMSWIGDSGDAFFQAAYSLERQYAQIIAKLKLNKEDLEKAKQEFLNQDNYIASKLSSVVEKVKSLIKK